MIKRYLKYFMIIIVIGIVIYKLPVNVDKSFYGVIVYNKDQKIEEHVTVRLQGKLVRNILTVNDFDGTISIGEDTVEANIMGAANLKMLIKMKGYDYYDFSYKPIQDNWHIKGFFYTSKDFNYIHGNMVGLDGKYEVNSNYNFVAPATNIDEVNAVEKKIYGLIFE